MTSLSPDIGTAALKSFLETRSPLGPLGVMAERVGKNFPLPSFKPYVVFGPEAVRKVLVTDGEEHDHYRGLMEPSLHPPQLP